jgi:hypothetical protein
MSPPPYVSTITTRCADCGFGTNVGGELDLLKRARRFAVKLVGGDPSNVPAVHPWVVASGRRLGTGAVAGRGRQSHLRRVQGDFPIRVQLLDLT